MKEGANVVELGVPPLENSGLRPCRAGAGWATVMASEVLDWLRACTGEEGEGERGEGEAENMADFGLPTPLEPGEAEAFRANGLLRTDMTRFSRQSSAPGPNHGMVMGDAFGDVVGGSLLATLLSINSLVVSSRHQTRQKSKHAKDNATQEVVKQAGRQCRYLVQAGTRKRDTGNVNKEKNEANFATENPKCRANPNY